MLWATFLNTWEPSLLGASSVIIAALIAHSGFTAFRKQRMYDQQQAWYERTIRILRQLQLRSLKLRGTMKQVDIWHPGTVMHARKELNQMNETFDSLLEEFLVCLWRCAIICQCGHMPAVG
jgi:hypothetical protein